MRFDKGKQNHFLFFAYERSNRRGDFAKSIANRKFCILHFFVNIIAYMKLRIRGNSVRLRLTKTEVAQFGETGSVKVTVEFGTEPHQQFVYALTTSVQVEVLQASLKNSLITVLVPESQAKEWTQTNQVGLVAEQSIGDGKTLHILIEKDFACLEDRPDEDESEAFQNPLEGKEC